MTGVDLESCKRIVQYFWDPEPKNDAPEEPIWCLGQRFPPQLPQESNNEPGKQLDTGPATAQNDHTESSWPNAFLEDFKSRIWMTYRSNFPSIPRTKTSEATSSMTLSVRLRSQLLDSEGFTSDTGWGCMIRSGQSLLANTASILQLGRDWRRGNKPDEEARLLRMFADHPDAELSIHRFVQCGADTCGKYPGEWFGPSATARCIQTLTSECSQLNLNVYVTNDTADVYEDQFMRVACRKTGQMQPTLILFGLRLGIEKITHVYWEGLSATLQYPQSVGIAGGRPSSSHYFVGVQGSHFFFLDPHLTRPALPYQSADHVYNSEERESYYTRRIRRIHIKDMDPSMLIGFLIRDETDWNDWKGRVRSAPGKPIIHILAGDSPVDQGHGRQSAVDEVEALDDSDGLE